MENQSYKNLLSRAEANQLSPKDINEIVMVFAEKNTAVEKSLTKLKQDTAQNKRSIRDMEEEYPLLPPEAEDLSNAVKRKGAWVLGGKKANAYKNTNLRSRVYRDIYYEVKREYGLIDDAGRQKSYKKLKRKYLNGALNTVDEYELPIALANEVEAENEIDEM